MIHHIKNTLVSFLFLGMIVQVQAQQSVNSSSGVASGEGGEAHYSIGQSFYQMVSETNINSSEGVQQPHEISISSNIPLSRVKSDQCGTTLLALSTPIFAVKVSSAPEYRFKVVNGATERIHTVSSSYFKLTDLSGGAAYNTTYEVSVAVKINGVWGNYGVVCNITTPFATSKIRYSQCGATIPALNTNIGADIVSGAVKYRFEVTNGEVVRTITSSSYLFKLTNLSGGALYNTTYSIKVAVSFDGVDFGPFGTACDVSTISSKIRYSQCGATIGALNTNIGADVVSGAVKYRFEVTNGETVRTITSSSYLFKLSNLAGGVTYNTTYSVKVAFSFNGTTYSPFGVACNITTPLVAPKEAMLDEEVTTTTSAYPNPYTESFKIAFSSESEANVQIMVYDASGRLVSQKETTSSNINTQDFGQGLSAGVYTVVLQQGERTETLRVVKN